LGSHYYQIVSATKGAEVHVQTADAYTPTTVKWEPRAHFDIILPERDPFLGYLPKKKKHVKVTEPKPKKTSKPVVWPRVSYQGNLKKNNGERSVYLINVNNQMQFFKIGDTLQGVLLQQGSKASVDLVFKDQQKTIPIAK